MSSAIRGALNLARTEIPPLYLPLISKSAAVCQKLHPNIPSKQLIGQAIFFSDFIQPIERIENKSGYDTRTVESSIQKSLLKTIEKIITQEYRLEYSDSAFLNPLIPSMAQLSPSLTTLRLLKGPTALDCTTAIQLIFKKTLLDLIGAPKFDALFSKKELKYALVPSYKEYTSPLIPFLEPASLNFIEPTTSDLALGSRVYFQGIPWYRAKHPIGAGCGYHAIMIDDNPPKFWALGLPRFLNEEEIARRLIYHYNQPRTTLDLQFIALCHTTDGFVKTLLKEQGHRLTRFHQELISCIEEPDIPIAFDDVYDKKMGFYGNLQAEKISPYMIHVIQSASLEQIASENFKNLILKAHLYQTCKRIEKTLSFDVKRNFSLQETNFIEWAQMKKPSIV